MKKSIKLFTLTTLGVIALNTIAYAANYVDVDIDGKIANYKEVKPQIINDYTMVPFRETAEEHFGLSVAWNEETRTMTLTKDKIEIKHTINQNKLYINGVEKDYGNAKSMIVENRTLMPIRMLAEALGSEINFDDKERKVYIKTSKEDDKESKEVGADEPFILSATPDKKAANIGDTIKITVLANKNTKKVKIINHLQAIIGISTKYTDKGDQREFIIDYKVPEKSTDETFFVFSGAENYKLASDLMFNVTINPGTQALPDDQQSVNVKVRSYEFDKEKYAKNATVNLKVFTELGSTKVEVEDNKGKIIATSTTPKKGTKENEFALTWKAATTGNYKIISSSSVRDVYTEKVEFEVIGSIDTDHDIDEVTTSRTSLDYGDKVYVTIRTGLDAKRVYIKGPTATGAERARSSSYNSGGASTNTWDLSFTAETTGTYYVYSENSEGEKDEKTFTLDVYGSKDSSTSGNTSDSLKVEDAYADSSNLNYGSTAKIFVTTNEKASSVVVKNPSGDTVKSTTSYTTVNSQRKWELEFEFKLDTSGDYKVYAKDGSNESEAKVVRLTSN